MAARRTLVALASSIAIVTAGALASPAEAHDHGRSPEKFAQKVTTKAVQAHLAALQRIADKNGGNRAALTSGYEESARYVERTLRKAGYTTERDPFTFDREIIDTATLTENSPGSAAYEVDQMEFSPNSPVGGVTADLVAPADPHRLPPRGLVDRRRHRQDRPDQPRDVPVRDEGRERRGSRRCGRRHLQQRPGRAAVRHPRRGGRDHPRGRLPAGRRAGARRRARPPAQ